MDTAGRYSFGVRTYECGADAFATLPSICNYLQEAASLNAAELKFSKTDFDKTGSNVSWVLTRLRIEMDEYPSWGDEAIVVTFPRGGRRIAAWRDFILETSSGRRLGVASSEWMLIDLSTRKIVPVPESVLAMAATARESVLGDAPFTPRLKFPENPIAPACSLALRSLKADVDLNRHVNNVHYIEWLLEPLDSLCPKSFEITFHSEATAGEEIHVETASNPDGSVMSRALSAGGRVFAIAKVGR